MSSNTVLDRQESELGIVCKHSFYSDYGKRFFDFIASGVALIILSPALLVLAFFVRVIHGSPIFFTPTRPGLNERIFRVFKFRTMRNAKNSEGKLLPEKDRLTKFGRFLRASSLDELPELINILRGDMSIVGPRPLAKGYLEYYTNNQRVRHTIRPGLTGLAQISGRNNLPWEQRIDKDIEYIKNISFSLDINIIIETLLKVVKHKDITIPGGKELDLAAHNLIKEEGMVHLMNKKSTWPEIGSHFWLDDHENIAVNDKFNWFLSAKDGSYTFSGRAAIAVAILDAMRHQKILKAYVPSYCCLSMLQPFIDLDILYEFYDVIYDGNKITYNLDETKECDILLVMKYFGTEVDDYDIIINKMKKKNCVVIEDITHTLLNDYPTNTNADYYVASLRKWFPVPAGGIVLKANGNLQVKPNIDSNNAVENKIQAMREKKEYIIGERDSKNEYLQKFSNFEQDLIQLDVLLNIDDTSKNILDTLNIMEIKRRRRGNAAVLYQRLKNITGLSFFNTECDFEKGVPLFVPILLPTEKRDELRHYLIEKGVYCPIHWPEVMGAKKGIRDYELSLVCDQRYNENDMNYMADLIVEWFNDNLRDKGKS